jgi:type IV secretion system protein VirB10
MTDQTFAPTAPHEPELKKKPFDPKGVMQKNGKAILFLGVAALLLVALIFSSHGKGTSAHQNSAQTGPQPLVQDNTENNVADLKSHVADQQRAMEQATAVDPAMTGATPAQRVAAQAYSPNGQAAPCIPGQPCNPMPTYGYAQQGSGQAQLSPAEQASQQLAAKERERSYESRFSSNLAYTRQPDAPSTPQAQSASTASGYIPANMTGETQQASSLIGSRTAGETPAPATGQASIKRGP